MFADVLPERVFTDAKAIVENEGIEYHDIRVGGSYSTGMANEHSDVDFIVVVDDDISEHLHETMRHLNGWREDYYYHFKFVPLTRQRVVELFFPHYSVITRTWVNKPDKPLPLRVYISKREKDAIIVIPDKKDRSNAKFIPERGN